MSYATYANPQEGYHQYAQPKSTYTKAEKPAVSSVATDGKEGTFTELLVTDGVGDYHINHFIGYGAYQQLKNPQERLAWLNKEFYRRFVEVFSPNEATAEKGKYSFKGKDTIEFKIGNDLWTLVKGLASGDVGPLAKKLAGLAHSDWVSIEMSDDGVSFYASTLKRKWMWDIEKLALSKSEDWRNPIEVNQHHFLAGRRSFKIGYSEELTRLYVETVAFERSSLCEYNVVEKNTGVLRKEITNIWTNLIENVENSFGKWISPSKLVNQKVRQGYQTEGNVDYRVGQYKNAAQGIKEFDTILQRHPGLRKGLSL